MAVTIVNVQDPTTTTNNLAIDSSGRIGINNWPGVQTVTGTVQVAYFPANQIVSGTIDVTDRPARSLGIVSIASGAIGTNTAPAYNIIQDATTNANKLKVNADGSISVQASGSDTVIVQRAAITLLNQASAAQTISGNSADLTTSQYTEVSVDIAISAISGTATPSIQFFVNRKGVDTVYYPIWSSAIQIATGKVSTSIGSGCVIAQSLGSTVQLSWTITGTTPSFTFSASLIAK